MATAAMNMQKILMYTKALSSPVSGVMIYIFSGSIIFYIFYV